MPNIVFIHAESMDGRKMGCMGDRAAATPNLDSLSQSGVLFRNAYSTCPVCNPSRASMWSGQYPHAYDCWNNHEGLRLGTPTFMTALARAGYDTNAVGPLDYQYGLHSIRDRIGSWTRAAEIERPICRTPMPSVRDSEVNASDWNHTYTAIRWLSDVAQGPRPFMLYLTTGLVHPAFVVQQRHLDRIESDNVEVPPTLGPITDFTHPVDRYMRITKNCDQPFSEDLVHHIRQCYYGMIASLDDMVGRVLKTLSELGLTDSTYVIFSSDHGEMAGEQNQILKRSMYESSIHVPLMISGPDVRSGATVDDPVSLVDIYPTLMEMSGAEYQPSIGPAGNDFTEPAGESLMPQLVGSEPRERSWAFAEYNGDRCNTGVYMLRDRRYKYLHHHGFRPQLFDLPSDPWEAEDIAADNRDVVERMESILQDGVGGETPDTIDARAKSYDRDSFLKWRSVAQQSNEYSRTMAHVYSGYDRLCIEDIVPWREEDEEKIRAWLS
jgi:arylsulfatase A-like enzyme